MSKGSGASTYRLHGLYGQLGHVSDGEEERHEHRQLDQRHHEDLAKGAIVGLHQILRRKRIWV